MLLIVCKHIGKGESPVSSVPYPRVLREASESRGEEMVVFICNACGNSIKKNKVEKHYQTECSNCSVLSCIDCGKDFVGDAYQQHTTCISEAEKYQGKLFKDSDRGKPSKGEQKQQDWMQVIVVESSKGGVLSCLLLRRSVW